MELFAELFDNKVKVNGKESEIIGFIGSGLWRVKTVDSNTVVASYHTRQIDWGEVDPEVLKKRLK